MSQKEPLVIFLDQWCWIELAKIRYGCPSEKEKELLTKIENAVKENRAIFPITLCNADETLKIVDDKRRERLADLMLELSNAYSFQPYFDSNFKLELKNVVFSKLGLPQIHIKEIVLKQGLSNLVGAKAEATLEGCKPIPKGLKKELEDSTESPECLKFLLAVKSIPSPLKTSQINVLEAIRNDLWKVKDSNLRYRVFLAQNTIKMIAPEIVKLTVEWNLPNDFIIRDGMTQKEMYGFIDSLPTALCFFTLLYQRDQQRSRPIQANDFNDIWSLTIAIPYSDIVVTEGMWTSIAVRSKLDKKCNTRILASIQSLAEFL